VVEAALSGSSVGLSAENADLSDLLRLAQELRTLPSPAFRARLGRELRPPLEARSLREAARDLGPREDRRLASLDRLTILLSRFSGATPWERHPDGDEMILVLEGGGEITVLHEDGPVRAELRPSSLFVCPRGLWHRTVAAPSVTALYLTPLEGSEHSWADDPRGG
jgi:mannose-6-phosphate isomerase-like protein (cupin superfamily)